MKADFLMTYQMESDAWSMQTKTNTRGTLNKAEKKEKASITSLMAQYFKEYGNTISRLREDWIFQMEISLKVYSKITKEKRGFTNTKMGMFMKVAGSKTLNMEKESFCFKMVNFMMVIFAKVKNMAKGLTDGQTVMFIMEGLYAIKKKELGSIDGVMVLFTKDIGEQVKWMDSAE